MKSTLAQGVFGPADMGPFSLPTVLKLLKILITHFL